MNVASGVQLQRDSALADRIYTALQGCGRDDISVSDIESQFRFKWREIDVPTPHGAPRRLDPYFAQHITSVIAQSFHTLVFLLPGRLAALPGLNANQVVEAMRPQLNHACNILYERLCPILVGAVPNATHEMLVQEAAACAAELTRLHTAPAHQLISEQIKGLRVLQSICSDSMEDEPIADTLFREADVLQTLATQPPHQLVDELVRERVPFTELADFLVSDVRYGVRGAAALPASGAAREMSIQRWAKAYGETVMRCLVSARQALHVLSTSPDTACAWHGVLVASTSNALVNMAVDTGGTAAAVQCTRATHTSSLDDVVVASTSTTDPVALLVPRLVRVVSQLVEQKCLSVRKLRADLLLPLVTRWKSEAMIECERLVATGAFPEGLGSIELPDEARPMDEDDTEDHTVHPQAVLAPPQPVAERFGPRIEAGTVPLSLERDHAIVVCIRDLIKERVTEGGQTTNGTIYPITLRVVVSRVMARANESLRASERSTIQSVGGVFTKLVHRYEDPTVVAYWKTDAPWDHSHIAGKPKGAALVVSGEELSKLLDHLNRMVDDMRINGTAFAKVWFPSRSARSHSRRSLWQRRHGARAEDMVMAMGPS